MSADAIKQLPDAPPAMPEPDGCGALDEACKLATAAGTQILTRFGDRLLRRDRMKAVATFRRVLIPAKRPGRRPKETITAAYRDWTMGMRGVELFRTHIPGWTRHNYWRRKAESQSLMDAIHTRARRERKARRDSSPNSSEHPSP